MKIILATYHFFASATATLAYGANALHFAGPNDDTWVHAYSGGTSKPACAIPACAAGTGYNAYYYPTTSGYCNGLHPSTPYYQRTKNVNVYNCPGSVYYYTCTDGGFDETLCGTQTTFTCPDGSCDPYDPGHPG